MRRTVTGAFIALALLGFAAPASSQELEPRSYSPTPVDSNFLVGTVSNSTGTVPLDSTQPLSDVRPAINAAALSFTHTFRFAGRTASWALVLPYAGGHVTAALLGQPIAIARYGFADVRARLGVSLLGKPLTPAEFARRTPATTLGASVTVTAPTGTYDSSQFLNVGSNRWTIKPEIGAEQPMGKWFADASAGVWIFGNNANYFRGKTLRQSPLAIFQLHAGYNFRPGQWLALDANRYAGGATSANGGEGIDALSNSRYGLSFSQPMGAGVSAKVSWSHWLDGQYGQRFTTIAAALQYLWFNAR